MSTATSAIPVLDLRRFDASDADRAAFLTELREAAHTLGGFYLSGHGIAPELIEQSHALSRQFFDLPEADKLAVEMANSPHFRGYTRVGWERTRGLADWREQIDIDTERPALAPSDRDPAWHRLQGPNQWPTALPELRPVALKLQAQLTEVALKLGRALAVALDQPEDVFAPLFANNPRQLLKLIRYPGRPEGEDRQGVGPHKDSGFLTFVLQTEQSGLQVETAEGWVDLPPIPGTFVVNISEQLELATNGYLRANVHQVLSPAAETDRLSIAYFLGAQLDATIPALTLPPTFAAKARGIDRDPTNPLFRQVGENTLKGRLRSHPDVAQRYYGDVLARSA